MYLDSANITGINEYVLKKIFVYSLKERYILKKDKKKKEYECKKKISEFLNCKVKNIIITSGSTESNNIIINSFFKNNPKKNAITFTTEHKSIIETYKKFKRVQFIKKNLKGFYKLKYISEKVNKKTKLISISWINNEIGVIQNIEKISKFCSNKGIYLHVDATQAFGKIKINLKKINITFMSFSCSKTYGPGGIGVIYKKKIISPLFQGGNQENKIRPGTISFICLIGLLYSVKYIMKNFSKINRKILAMHSFFFKKNKENIKINGLRRKTIKNIINFKIKNTGYEIIKMFFENTIYSFHSNCYSEKKNSYVLKEIGLSDKDIKSSVRISLDEKNNISDIKKITKIINNISDYSKKNYF
ncbi:cysteine desulfurase family protein [Candidatus Vidania fulgoroideorum]